MLARTSFLNAILTSKHAQEAEHICLSLMQVLVLYLSDTPAVFILLLMSSCAVHPRRTHTHACRPGTTAGVGGTVTCHN
jgi:hypothetical protein